MRTILADHTSNQIPLIRTPQNKSHHSQTLRQTAAADLFPGAPYPQEAQAGLLLFLNDWEESHRVAQDLHTAEASYWHGIAHRIDPDPANAAYWFRRVGNHPLYNELFEAAKPILQSQRTKWRLKSQWDPFLFIDWCQQAAAMPGTAEERVALGIQKAEWELLFTWCGAQRP